MKVESVPASVNMNTEGTALICENSSDISRLITVINWWNVRWEPNKPWHLERIDDKFVQELNDAWRMTIDRENSGEC